MKNLWVRFRQWLLRVWRVARGMNPEDGRLNLPPMTPMEQRWFVEFDDNGTWREAYLGRSGSGARVAFENLKAGKFKARCWENNILRGEC